MYGGAEHVAIFEHHRTVMAADADGDRLSVDLQLRVRGDLLLHLRRGVQRGVGARKGGHDLIAHGLDDRALALLGGSAHHVDADRHHVAGAQVTHGVVKPGRSDDVGKQDGEFDILAHECVMIIRERTRPATNGLTEVPPRKSRAPGSPLYRPSMWRVIAASRSPAASWRAT